jgi:DNA (cytosine-5)-methyltransferase 1
VYHRWLTNLERARAQGFPDNYRFHGGHRVINGKRVDEVRTQIGNTVSVNVARWFGHRITVDLNRTRDQAARNQYLEQAG